MAVTTSHSKRQIPAYELMKREPSSFLPRNVARKWTCANSLLSLPSNGFCLLNALFLSGESSRAPWHYFSRGYNCSWYVAPAYSRRGFSHREAQGWEPCCIDWVSIPLQPCWFRDRATSLVTARIADTTRVLCPFLCGFALFEKSSAWLVIMQWNLSLDTMVHYQSKRHH